MIVNLYLAGLYIGFDQGYFAVSNVVSEREGWQLFGGRTIYGDLAQNHALIFVLATVFLILRRAREASVSKAGYCLVLCAILFITLRWGAWITSFDNWSGSLYLLLSQTVILGWISSVLIGLLTVIEALHLSKCFIRRDTRANS